MTHHTLNINAPSIVWLKQTNTLKEAKFKTNGDRISASHKVKTLGAIYLKGAKL